MGNLNIKFYSDPATNDQKYGCCIGIIGDDEYCWGLGNYFSKDHSCCVGWQRQGSPHGYSFKYTPKSKTTTISNSSYGESKEGVYYIEDNKTTGICEFIDDKNNNRTFLIEPQKHWVYGISGDKITKLVRYLYDEKKIQFLKYVNGKKCTDSLPELDEIPLNMEIDFKRFVHPHYYYSDESYYKIYEYGIIPQKGFGQSFWCNDEIFSLGCLENNKCHGITLKVSKKDNNEMAFCNANNGINDGEWLFIDSLTDNYTYTNYDNGKPSNWKVQCKFNDQIWLIFYNYKDPNCYDYVTIDKKLNVWVEIKYNEKTKKSYKSLYYSFDK